MSTLHVVFKVGASEYVLPAKDVLHLESFTEATRVPGTPPYVIGIVQIRGRVVPVVDLHARFGLEPAQRTLDARVLVARHGERVVGLLVDSAREVLQIPEDSFRPPPQMLSEQSDRFVAAVAQAGKRLVMLIDFEAVVGRDADTPARPATAGEPHVQRQERTSGHD